MGLGSGPSGGARNKNPVCYRLAHVEEPAVVDQVPDKICRNSTNVRDQFGWGFCKEINPSFYGELSPFGQYLTQKYGGKKRKTHTHTHTHIHTHAHTHTHTPQRERERKKE